MDDAPPPPRPRVQCRRRRPPSWRPSTCCSTSLGGIRVCAMRGREKEGASETEQDRMKDGVQRRAISSPAPNDITHKRRPSHSSSPPAGPARTHRRWQSAPWRGRSQSPPSSRPTPGCRPRRCTGSTPPARSPAAICDERTDPPPFVTHSPPSRIAMHPPATSRQKRRRRARGCFQCLRRCRRRQGVARRRHHPCRARSHPTSLHLPHPPARLRRNDGGRPFRPRPRRGRTYSIRQPSPPDGGGKTPPSWGGRGMRWREEEGERVEPPPLTAQRGRGGGRGRRE